MAKLTSDQKDAQIDKLMAVVAQQKAEIAKAERPKWETNCSFAYDEESGSRTNIQTIHNPSHLVRMCGYLLEKAQFFALASEAIGFDGPEFKWMGFTVAQWTADFKTRMNKIQIAKKKAKLEAAESALDKLVSPERRQELELERLTKELGV